MGAPFGGQGGRILRNSMDVLGLAGPRIAKPAPVPGVADPFDAQVKALDQAATQRRLMKGNGRSAAFGFTGSAGSASKPPTTLRPDAGQIVGAKGRGRYG